MPPVRLLDEAHTHPVKEERFWWLRLGPLVYGAAAFVLSGLLLALEPLGAPVAPPFTAVVPGLLGAALLLAFEAGPRRRWGARVFAAAALATAVPCVVSCALLAGPAAPLSLFAAAAGVLLAVALLATLSGTRDGLLCEAVTVAASAASLFALAGLLASPGIAPLDRIAGAPLPAALTLVGFGTLLLRPGCGLVHVLAHGGPSGKLMRRHFAVALALPLLLATAISAGERSGWYSDSSVVAALVAGTTLVLLAVTRFGAAAVFLAETEHEELVAERSARAEAERHAAQLEENGRALRQALGLRDEFLAVAAHELRTPLTVVALNIQALARHAQGLDERAHRRIEAARAQIARLVLMIEGLLDASRLADGELVLSAEEVDLAEIAREVTRARAGDLRASGSLLELAADRAVGIWDRRRVAQLVDLLLDNAIKYGRGERIELAVEPREQGARLTVRDHGMGISPERAGRLFERYGRAVSERHYGGFGLGLWTAKQVVSAMGGTIAVASELDAGTTFTVELPRATTGAAVQLGARPAPPRASGSARRAATGS